MLTIKDIHVSYGAIHAIKGVSLTVNDGEIVSLIGANGAGKSTLFKLITGQETPDSGSVAIGDTVRLGYVDQSRDALDPKIERQ